MDGNKKKKKTYLISKSKRDPVSTDTTKTDWHTQEVCVAKIKKK